MNIETYIEGLSQVAALTDVMGYLVIASGNSNRHVKVLPVFWVQNEHESSGVFPCNRWGIKRRGTVSDARRDKIQ